MKSLSVFREAFNSLSSRYSLAGVAALFVAVAVCGYYFYFLVNRSNDLDQRQYRVLHRIENQLQINLEGFKELAVGQVEAATKEIRGDQQLRLEYEKIISSKYADTSKVEELLTEKMRSVSFVQEARRLHSGLVMTQCVLEDKDYNFTLYPVVTVHHNYIDSLFSIHVDYPWEQAKMVIGVDYTLSVGGALKPLLRYDMFDGYVVLHSDSVIFETISSGIQLFKPDTLEGDIGNTSGDLNSVKRVAVNGISYRVYEVGFSTESETGWTIVGLKDNDEFARERRTVPRHYLFGVFIIAIFIVLGIPFMKSMIMSRTERLSTTDVLFSAVSLALGAAVVSILFLDGYLRMDVDDEEQSAQLRALSVQVEANLVEETNLITDELSAYRRNVHYEALISSLAARLEAVKLRDSMIGQQITDTVVRRSQQLHSIQQYRVVEELIDSLHRMNPPYKAVIYPGFNNFFLVDTNYKTQRDVKTPGVSFNVRPRKYATAWKNGECMQMTGGRRPMFLDAIVSWREQQYRAAVSLPVNDTFLRGYTAVAMTTQLRTITNPVLPEGRRFCIFTVDGTVMFHSESSRCLNENLIEECSGSPELIAAITARADTFMNVEYSGTRGKLYVRPLTNTPYFIGTYADQTPVDAVHGQVFGVAFILQVLLFAFYVCLIFFGLLVLRRTTRLRNALLDLSVFTPDVNGTERYAGAVLFNILHGILLLVSACLLQGSLTVIILFFISAPYTVLLNIILLSNLKLNELFRPKYRKLVISLLVAICVVNVVAWQYVSVQWVLPFIQIVCLIMFYCIEHRLFNKMIREWFNIATQRLNYRIAYTLVIFVLVMTTCVLPAVSFSILTYNKEKEIAVKTTQLQLLSQFTRSDFKNTKDAYRPFGNYSSPFYATALTNESDSGCLVRESSYRYDAFSSWMRGMVQNAGQKYSYISFGASDSTWRWCRKDGDTITLSGRNMQPCKPDYAYKLNSIVPMFKVPLFYNADFWLTLRFWTLMLLAIAGLYFVLRFFTKKIFILEKYSRTRALEFDKDFLRKADAGYKAFVTGMPAAGKTNFFTAMCSNESNVHYINFIRFGVGNWQDEIDKAKLPGKGIVLIDHFEHDLLNKDLSMFKLNFIEQLVALKDKKVVVISSIPPGVFTNMLETGRKDCKGEERNCKEVEASQQSFERWNRVLAAFYVFIFPLQNYYIESETILGEYLRIKKLPSINVPVKLVNFVEKECTNGLFLRTIGLELMDELHRRESVQQVMDDDASRMEREDIIIRTQKMAESYYRSLWNHLAVEEQFVLHDLAQDGLVNARNLDIVEVLIDKGLVIYDTRLRVMNNSFRNFILTVVGPTDLGKMDIEMRNSGTWSKLKPALILIVFSLFLFIIKSDRTQLFGYFTAFGAILPVVVTLLSRFNQADKKE